MTFSIDSAEKLWTQRIQTSGKRFHITCEARTESSSRVSKQAGAFRFHSTFRRFRRASFVFCCLQDADVLYGKHQEVSSQLETKYNETRLARERAAALKERASDMYTSTKTKVDRLTGTGFTGAVAGMTILRKAIGFRGDLCIASVILFYQSSRDVFSIWIFQLCCVVLACRMSSHGAVFQPFHCYELSQERGPFVRNLAKL